MQNALMKEIETYVGIKRDILSPRTLSVITYVLRSIAPHFDNPHGCYKALIRKGLSRYTIQTYFNYAGSFELEVRGTSSYRTFLKQQAPAFKNCYHEKTRQLKREDYDNALNMYRNSNPRMFNLLVLMGEAGLRISEAASVKWTDFEAGYLKIVGKGNKQRLIPFDLSKLQKNDSPFIAGKVGFRFYFKRDMKPFTPHDFRSFFATSVVNHPELNIKDAAMLLGHSSITTTSRYVRSDLERVAKVLSKI